MKVPACDLATWVVVAEQVDAPGQELGERNCASERIEFQNIKLDCADDGGT